MARLGRDGWPLPRTASGRVADRRDRQLYHAVRVVRTRLAGGSDGGISMRSAAAEDRMRPGIVVVLQRPRALRRRT
jgi:hypothetical protein